MDLFNALRNYEEGKCIVSDKWVKGVYWTFKNDKLFRHNGNEPAIELTPFEILYYNAGNFKICDIPVKKEELTFNSEEITTIKEMIIDLSNMFCIDNEYKKRMKALLKKIQGD